MSGSDERPSPSRGASALGRAIGGSARLLVRVAASKAGLWVAGGVIVLVAVLVSIALFVGGFQGTIAGRPACPAASSAGGLEIASGGLSAAREFARSRDGRVSFALVDAQGRLLAGVDVSAHVHGASITKAMVLVARLRQLRHAPHGRDERALMTAMVRRSDNGAANELVDRVGVAAVRRVAHAAGMADFVLRGDDDVYRLGNSLITAGDQARFFARLEELLPARARRFALGLMEAVELGRWGILDADLGEHIATKAGWRPEAAGGWTVVQGAHLTVAGEPVGLAVLTDGNPSQEYGEQTIRGVATRLLRAAPGSSGAVSERGPPGIKLVAGGPGRVVGASEFGGPQDPGTGSVGAYQDSKGRDWDLERHPDSYAELGGLTRESATLLGGLRNMQPLRVTYRQRAAILYKRDFGDGGGAVRGHVRAIDLWYRAADALGFSGTDLVRVQRIPPSGAGALTGTLDPVAAGAQACPSTAGVADVPLTAGERATILPDGRAAAPASAPREVRQIIAAGNQINGRPYGYGACHGSVAKLCAQYDCSSAVSYLLYKAGLHGSMSSVSGDFDNWRSPGNGKWITTASNADHIYMYVAGIRFDTHQYGSSDTGPNSGIGWHPARRPDAGFHLRHPEGL